MHRPVEISNKTPLHRSANKAAVCCETCGIVFEKPAAWIKRTNHHYCGKPCFAESLKIKVEVACVVCGATYITNPSRALRVVTCSRRCHRIKKVRNEADLYTRNEAKAARQALCDATTHCASCEGEFGPEMLVVEGMEYALASDGVTVICSGSPRVVCMVCHLETVGHLGAPAREAKRIAT